MPKIEHRLRSGSIGGAPFMRRQGKEGQQTPAILRQEGFNNSVRTSASVWTRGALAKRDKG